jgi:hypothetical protein
MREDAIHVMHTVPATTRTQLSRISVLLLAVVLHFLPPLLPTLLANIHTYTDDQD